MLPAMPASSIPTTSLTASRHRRTTRSCPCAPSTTRSRSGAARPTERAGSIAEILQREPESDQGQADPYGDDDKCCRAARWPLGGLACREAMLSEDVGRYQPHRQQDAERDDDQVVEVADDRDEVWDEVDGRERVGGDRERHRLGVP